MIANNILILLLVIIDCTKSITFAFQISYYHPRHRSSSHLASTTTSSSTSTHHHCKLSSPNLLLDSIDEIITSQSQSLSISQNDIINNVNIQHEQDVAYAKSSTLPFENDNISMRSSGDDGYSRSLIEYETIPSNNNEQPPIAIQTNQPILNKDEIKLLTNSCETYWKRNEEETQSSKSRFTYQRKGNSEAHLSDVVQYHTSQQYQQQGLDTSDLQSSSSVEHLVNDLLLDRIYPWVRTAYLSNEEEHNVDELELYVYDSLFIRYNATEANIGSQLINDKGSQEDRGSNGQERRVGAGQPLHRDLGYVSVNIMLNSQDEFEGGGTFFENKLLPMMMISDDKSSDEFYKAEVQPLKPRDVGHAIAHYSSNRHAGAATLRGVRDILVMFLAAATPNKQSTAQPSSSSIPSTDNDRKQQPPKWELNARIKSAARSYCTSHCPNNKEEQVVCRILHHRLAIDQVGDDGEAWHYLGMALLDYYNHQVESSSNEAADIEGTLELAISCLNVASEYTPCDGRIHNNLGIALERQQSNSMREDLHSEIVSAYETSIMIHSKCKSVGCDVGADYESACLNYGLYLSKLDLFDDAIDVLSRIAGEKAEHQSMVTAEEGLDAAGWARQRVRRDAQGLLSFCKRQV